MLVAGCESRPVLRHAEHRLVDLARAAAFDTDFGTNWQPPAHAVTNAVLTNHHEIGSIGNDTRFVLAAPPYELLASTGRITAPSDGRVRLRPPLPPEFLDAAVVLALPSVRVGGVWTDLAPLFLNPGTAKEAPGIDLDLLLPEEAREQDVVVNVFAYGLVWGRQTRLTSPPIRIPPGATLEMAVGLKNPGGDPTAATCTVQSCADSKCQSLFTERLAPSDADADVPWRNVRIDLAHLAGQETRFEFACRHDDGDGLPASFPLWGHPTVFVPRPIAGNATASNVVLISLDTLSAKHLDLYGYPHATAPKLTTRFRTKGAVFENCMAAATATAPSHMTMLTGLHPLQHRMTDGLGVASLAAIPVAESIRGQGISTAAFTENGWLSIGHGFGRGFDSFAEDRSPDMMAPVGRIERTFGHAKAWLEANRDKSFFLFLHTFEVHDPHHPPEAYQEMFLPDGGRPLDPSAPRVVRDRVAYDQEIRYTDDQLELLMQRIDELGLADTTLVIVTSDHGEAFGEHGYVVHGNFMYEEVLHVPLMMQGPGVHAGTLVRDVVGHVDIAPTVLGVLGVSPPPAHTSGMSLQPYLNDGRSSRRDRKVRALFAESWGDFALTSDRELVRFSPPALVARIGSRKIARYREGDGARYEAYDLGVDPDEANDLFTTNPDLFADLRTLVDNYPTHCARTRERIESATPLEGGAGKVILSPDQEEKLRALGYIQ